MVCMSLANMAAMDQRHCYIWPKAQQNQSNKETNEKSAYNRNCKANEYIKIIEEQMMEELKEIEEIALGSSGKVIKVSYKNKIYALKIMNHVKNSQNNFLSLQNFIKEYEIINKLSHPNILKTFGIYLNSGKKPPSILLEYCPNDLVDLISSKKLTNFEIVSTIYQIIEGMKCIHCNNIVHRDLKPSNILISDDGTIKICDFGMAQILLENERITSYGIGTLNFMAPEIIDQSDYNEKADVYSFGVLLYYILSNGIIPKIQIITKKKAEIPDSFTEFSKKLIDDCLNFDPNCRPSFEMILDDLIQNKYNLVNLTDSELQTVESFIKKHKKLIPTYNK